MKADFTKGLLPAIIQHAHTQKVLMLGYMNEEAFHRTLNDKRVTFFSRSKGRLWTKGEQSGNFLDVISMDLDCDKDTLLIHCLPQGPTCHTGNETCFLDEKPKGFLYQLEYIVSERKNQLSENSYVSQLFQKGINKIAQKVGEEAIEVVIEAKDNNRKLFLEESADLLFHFLVLLKEKGCSLEDVEEILKCRHEKR